MAMTEDETRTLATVWVCCILSILIMATRLVLGMVLHRKFSRGDGLTVAAIFFSFARIAFTHVIVLWRTNNISPDLGSLSVLSDREIYQREVGSKLTLAARYLYILLLWLQKGVLLSFYEGLVKDLVWGRRCVQGLWVILAVTYVAATISTFVECRPFDHYWKVLPITDKCAKAIVQLFVVGGLNLFTDILLMILPIPVLVKVHLTWKKKLQLTFLFSVGLVIIAVTSVRVPRTYLNASSETHRITWTTGEFLAASFVANAPTLYAYRRLLVARWRPDARRFSGGESRSGPRSGPRSDPQARQMHNLAGTTLTWGESDLDVTPQPSDIEAGLEIRENPEVDEIQPAQNTRKSSIANVTCSKTSDEKA